MYLPILSPELPARTLALSTDEKALLKPLCLLTIKPMMYVGNVLEDGFENNPHLDRLREHAAAEGAPVVALALTKPDPFLLTRIEPAVAQA